jgi:hypothetical protein
VANVAADASARAGGYPDVGPGVGANTAVFSVVHGVLLRPLPSPDADRLVEVFENNSRAGGLANRTTARETIDNSQPSFLPTSSKRRARRQGCVGTS